MALWHKVRIVRSCVGYSLLLYCSQLLGRRCFQCFMFSYDFRKRGRVYPVMLGKSLTVLMFYLVVDSWKVDMLAQSLWYTDIMSDVSLRPESWFEWQTRLVWYSGLQDNERDDWREVARALIDLLRCCEHGKVFGSFCRYFVGVSCDYYVRVEFIVWFWVGYV